MPTQSPSASASALAFTPPVTYGNPQLDLDREDRAETALVGYDGPMVTYSYVRQDDRFRFASGGGVGYGRGGWDTPSYFERRAINTTIGTGVR